MCKKESWGAIFATKEAHSTQRGQPPRMHGPGLWRHEQKEQRVTPVPMSGVNCDLWCPEMDSKDLGGRPEQDPGYTSRPWHHGPGMYICIYHCTLSNLVVGSGVFKGMGMERCPPPSGRRLICFRM